MTVCIHNGIVLSGLTNNQSRSAVLIKDSKIKDTFSEERFNEMHFGPDVRLIDAKGNYIVPGFIDTHIHGFTHIAVAPDGFSENKIRRQQCVTVFS